MSVLGSLRRLLNRPLRQLGFQLVRNEKIKSDEQAPLLYQHSYKGGYDQYRAVQIQHNKEKLDLVWADEATLEEIVRDLKANRLTGPGICHGARNGFEVSWFREQLGSDVIGTDISETASEFDNMVTWDFHEVNPEWSGRFDFIYTNSLDQAFAPDKALAAWVQQISKNGRIYIEHTMAHSPSGAGEMDPFGAHPIAMPYLLFTWGKGSYELVDILEVEEKQNNQLRAWVFVLAPIQAA